MTINIAAARERLLEKERERRKSLHILFEKACNDFNAIVATLIDRYNPETIYQWGSLLDEKLFWEHSDIDIGVKGIVSAQQHASMQADAERLTGFPVDLVNMDKIEPLYADSILKHGRIVYERQ